MSRAKRFAMLMQVTQLRLQANQASMALVVRKEAALRQKLRELAARRSPDGPDAERRDDAATIAGAEMQWQLWVAQRRNLINAELASVLAEKSECKARLSRAFGQNQVAQALEKKLLAETDKTRIRRAHYES